MDADTDNNTSADRPSSESESGFALLWKKQKTEYDQRRDGDDDTNDRPKKRRKLKKTDTHTESDDAASDSGALPSSAADSSSSSSSSYVSVNTPANTEEKGEIFCRCGDGKTTPAVQKTVKKEGPNKGRPYWTCPQYPLPEACKFFQFADRLETSLRCKCPGGKREFPRRGTDPAKKSTFEKDYYYCFHCKVFKLKKASFSSASSGSASP